jgi:2-oxoglutarate ferredoxin oxidoreductase subunit alpha
MVKTRAKKVQKIAEYVPEQTFDSGSLESSVLVIGWGSTYGAIKTAVRSLETQGYDVAHLQINYIQPMPRNMADLIKPFDKILIPEMNNGQLIKLIRDQYLVDAKPFNKIKGVPFESNEIEKEILKMLLA